MPELAAPWWLLGLLLLPLLRWLHRFQAGASVLRVPALFLWTGSSALDAGPLAGDPDPAWRRRGVLTALIVLALAGPHWSGPSAPKVHIWIDDRPSLFAQEADGRTRLDLAGEAIAEALSNTETDKLMLHALNRPGASRELTAFDRGSLADALRGWLTAPGEGPPAGPLPPVEPGTERWLVSDGAGSLDVWDGARFNRILRIGEATENLALVGLAARPSLTDPKRMLAQVDLVNAGNAKANMNLQATLDRAPLEARDISIGHGERASVGFLIPAGAAGILAAHLSSTADALDLDDDLSLDLDTLAVRTVIDVDGNCGAAVEAVVLAHPGLRLASDRPGRLRIWCGNESPPTPAPPTLWLAAGPTGPAPTASPIWSEPTPGQPLRLRPEWIRPLAPPDGAQGRALLAAGGQPLILEQRRPSLITVLFDLQAPELAARPEFPALIAFLLDRLAGEGLLFPVTRIARDQTLARVAPGPLPAISAPPAAISEPVDAAPVLLAAALLLLLADLMLLARRKGTP